MTILDTGPLVAMLDRTDAQHAWATTTTRRVTPPLVTCEAVISEACFLLQGVPRARRQLRLWAESDYLLHQPADRPAFLRALALMERYASVPMSFADACLVALAEATPGAKVFTLDQDFLIYRRHEDQPLALLAPFAQQGRRETPDRGETQ
jgi:predicted nucleic acid-binding protein